MIVAIAGATGLTGQIALDLLLADADVSQVVAIGRRPTGRSHPKLKELLLVEGCLVEPPRVDAFLCCLGTTIRQAGSQAAFEKVDLDLPLTLARQLHAQGCGTAAVVSAMGADEKSAIFYNRTKGRMEAGLREIGFRSLTILRPSLIDGKRAEARSGEVVGLAVMKLVSKFFVGSLRHYRAIRAETISWALVEAAKAARVGTAVVRSGDIAKPESLT